jgi:hypothetical protein
MASASVVPGDSNPSFQMTNENWLVFVMRMQIKQKPISGATHLCARMMRLKSVSHTRLRTDVLWVARLMKNWFSMYT